MPILFRGCDLNDAFLSEADLMNRFVGQELWLWGYSNSGRLGTGASGSTTLNFSSPVQTTGSATNWRQAIPGGTETIALKTDGTLWMWGGGSIGRRGDLITADRSSPVQTVAAGTNWRCIASGSSSMAALKTDGTLWTWGSNSLGVLGNNSTASQSSPVQTVSGGTNWKNVASGANIVSAIKTDGTLWLWGGNAITGTGQLGDNSIIPKSSPVQTVSGGTNWKCSAIGVNGPSNTAAIKTDGTLWTWGDAAAGRLGNNDTLVNRSSPIQTIAGGTNWKKISVSGCNTASIKTDGTLWLWGCNLAGRLGNNSTSNQSSPIQTIAGGTNWLTVAVGTTAGVAIKTNGTLWTWGSNAKGYLATNNTTSQSSPVQTVAGGTNWRSVGAGFFHLAATRLTEG